MSQGEMKLGVVGVLESEAAPATTPRRERTDHFSLFAQQKRGAPAGWRWSSIEAIGELGEKLRDRQYTQMYGYVHDGTVFKSGKRAGQLKPGAAVSGTERRLIFNMAEFDAFLREWELATGNCHSCDGTGDYFGKPCSRCFATGKAHP